MFQFWEGKRRTIAFSTVLKVLRSCLLHRLAEYCWKFCFFFDTLHRSSYVATSPQAPVAAGHMPHRLLLLLLLLLSAVVSSSIDVETDSSVDIYGWPIEVVTLLSV